MNAIKLLVLLTGLACCQESSAQSIQSRAETGPAPVGIAAPLPPLGGAVAQRGLNLRPNARALRGLSRVQLLELGFSGRQLLDIGFSQQELLSLGFAQSEFISSAQATVQQEVITETIPQPPITQTRIRETIQQAPIVRERILSNSFAVEQRALNFSLAPAFFAVPIRSSFAIPVRVRSSFAFDFPFSFEFCNSNRLLLEINSRSRGGRARGFRGGGGHGGCGF